MNMCIYKQDLNSCLHTCRESTADVYMCRECAAGGQGWDFYFYFFYKIQEHSLRLSINQGKDSLGPIFSPRTPVSNSTFSSSVTQLARSLSISPGDAYARTQISFGPRSLPPQARCPSPATSTTRYAFPLFFLPAARNRAPTP